MDNKTAKNKLRELRDSLSKVLDGKEYSSSEEIKEQSAEAIQQARKASSTLKKSFIEKIKDLPVVQKVSELGTAGSVAVSTAAVAQTNVAIDQTEVFVASVANDIVEERIEAPMFMDTFIDFHSLNDWGQIVLTEKVSEAQAFVAEASEQLQTSQPTAPSQDPTPESSASSNSSSSEKSAQTDQPGQTDKSSESQNQKQESKEKSSSEESKDNDSEKDKANKEAQDPEQKTEDTKQSQENNTSSETNTESKGVNNQLPIIETPIDTDDQSIRAVSPTM
jgi:outer membrane biosynthesis protein TonB